MRIYTINGNKFRGEKGFYRYAESTFTSGLNWKIGRNLNAFADILRGGFGMHDYGERIIVKWFNMKKSREVLPAYFYNYLVEILEEAENVVFERYEYALR